MTPRLASTTLFALCLFALSSGPTSAREQGTFARLWELPRQAGEETVLDDGLSVRIGLMEKRPEITVKADAAVTVRCEDEEWTLDGGAELRFRPGATEAAHLVYHVMVETIMREQEAQLPARIAHWEAKGCEVEAVEAGTLLRYRGHAIHDGRRFLLSVARCGSEEAAESACDALRGDGVTPFVVECALRAPAGSLDLVDGTGRVVATVEAPVTMTSAKPILVRKVEHGVGFPWHGFEDRSFRGALEVRVDKTGALQIINALPIEPYLCGVVPSEMSWSYPHEALCSQAVAARGETLAKIGVRHLADPYDLCSEQHCQVYSGLSREHENSNAAVEATAGRVLRRDGKIVDTVYSACCGGHTEHNHMVWTTQPDPALTGVPCLAPGESFPDPMTEAALSRWFSTKPEAWCAHPPSYGVGRYRWTVTKSASDMDALVRASYPSVGRVLRLEPVQRGVSGRLRKLRIVGSGSSVIIEKEWPIRKLFGGLNSAAFVCTVRGDAERPSSFTFTGGGWGHGVGMCQWGARGMAQAGRSHRQILTHYFQDTEILPLYALDPSPLR